MKKALFGLLLTVCFTLATALDPYFQEVRVNSEHAPTLLIALLGDSRRLFARQFYTMADAYFHSGFYPSIFDSARLTEKGEDLNASAERNHVETKDDDAKDDFRGAPMDWIDRFGRNFYPPRHTHLSDVGHGKEAEMLPWLKLAAEMDPNSVETYVTASYWLRSHLNQPDEAARFLREGLQKPIPIISKS